MASLRLIDPPNRFDYSSQALAGLPDVHPKWNDLSSRRAARVFQFLHAPEATRQNPILTQASKEASTNRRIFRSLRRMIRWLHFVVGLSVSAMKSRRNLLLENAALRHQLLVLSREARRPHWNPVDRVVWVWLSLAWDRWSKALWLVQPDTVIGWHRQGFRLFWRWKSQGPKAGRKSVVPETIALIRQMSLDNPLWGAPRIHGELLKLGISVAQRTVGKYMVQHPHRSKSQTWTSFLRNHLGMMVSVDFFTVPTLRFQVLYVFLVLSHTRRQVLHFNITDAPSARWTA